MDKKLELALIGGGALVLVGIAVVSGNQSSAGIAFSQPDPTNVAAVENANVAEANNTATAANQRIGLVSQALVALSTLQSQVNLAQIDYNKSVAADNAATAQVGLQTSAQVQENATNDSTVLAQTKDQDSAADAVAQTVANANTAIATIAGNTQTYVAGQQAAANENAANEAAAASETQSHTQQQNGLWSSIASIASGVLSFFNPASGGGIGNPTDTNPSVYDLANQAPSISVPSSLPPIGAVYG